MSVVATEFGNWKQLEATTATRLEAIATRLEAIATSLEAISTKLGRRPSLLGWRPLLLGWRPLLAEHPPPEIAKAPCQPKSLPKQLRVASPPKATDRRPGLSTNLSTYLACGPNMGTKAPNIYSRQNFIYVSFMPSHPILVDNDSHPYPCVMSKLPSLGKVVHHAHFASAPNVKHPPAHGFRLVSSPILGSLHASSFLLLVVRPGAPSSILAPSSDVRSP